MYPILQELLKGNIPDNIAEVYIKTSADYDQLIAKKASNQDIDPVYYSEVNSAYKLLKTYIVKEYMQEKGYKLTPDSNHVNKWTKQ